MQLCQDCLQHMAPADVAAAAAFAAAGGPWPLPLPPGSQQLTPVALADGQRQQLLAAALDILDCSSSAAQGAGADAGFKQQVRQLRQQHALLAANCRMAAACAGCLRAQLEAAQAAAQAEQQAALAAAADAAGDIDTTAASGDGTLNSCLQQLLTTGCPAAAVLRIAAVLLTLQQQPEQAPPAADDLLAQPAAAAAAQNAVAAAAEAAVAAALQAMSGAAAIGGDAQEPQLSAGDAVQNLFGLLRSLHQRPEGASAAAEAAAAAAATAEALGSLRLLVWRLLQQQAAAYDGTGGAAATEAHLQASDLRTAAGVMLPASELATALWTCITS